VKKNPQIHALIQQSMNLSTHRNASGTKIMHKLKINDKWRVQELLCAIYIVGESWWSNWRMGN